MLTQIMGGICSKSSAYSGGHTVLSNSPSGPPSPSSGRPRPVNDSNPAAAAAAAAERRAKDVRPHSTLWYSFKHD